MLEVSSGLVRAETAAGAVRAVVGTSFDRLRIPTVGLLPERAGPGWYVVSARGVGVGRGQLQRSIEGVRARGAGRSVRGRLATRVAQSSGRVRFEAFAAGPAVLLAADVRPDHRAFLRTAASLLAEALERLGVMDRARQRSDELDLALALTAHELRAPLVGARAALGHVRIHDDGPASDELLDRSRIELDRLVGLVDPLLRWSAGRTSIRRRRADLVSVVEEAVSACRLELPRARVQVRAPDELPCRIDVGELRAAIGNVVRNALRYTPSRTVVTVTVDEDEGFARVRVRDRGPGIPAAERGRIFDPFARGPLAGCARSGRGLGLYLARRVVEAHGGGIGVRSARPGAEFVIELPVGIPGRLPSAS